MKQEGNYNPGEHQPFLEWCALRASGSLSSDQLKRLDEHLDACADCRKALQQFEEIESMGFAALAPVLAGQLEMTEEELIADRGISKLLARVEDGIRSHRSNAGLKTNAQDISAPPKIELRGKRITLVQRAVHSVRTFLPYAAMVFFTTFVGFYCYQLGARGITSASEAKLTQAQARSDALQATIAQLSKDHEVLTAKLQENARTIDSLAEKTRVQLQEIASLDQQKNDLASRAEDAEEKKRTSDSDRDGLNRKLVEAQATLASMELRNKSVQEERASELLQVSNIEKRLEEISASLKDRDLTIQQQRDLLTYDRDIRDLIGARDLYVAEVTDVGRDGETNKPFGRVFFTKGKSLIFYAYDLDKQPNMHNASTFQAWGRRGPDFQEALPLGILYLDGSSNRRWVLKFDDPRALAKIDAVFVTVEPKGGSQRPSGKPVLFAYLKVEPNHP